MIANQRRALKLTTQGLISVALTGVLLQLPGCGGGGTTVGAPLNPAPGPAAPAPLTVNPSSVVLYSGQPSSLLISGGVPPYRAFSSNPAVLPVAQDVIGSVVPVTVSAASGGISGNTEVSVTITDSSPNSSSTTVGVTAVPSPFLDRNNALSVTASNCGSLETNTAFACAGQTALMTLVLQAPTGAPLAGRQVRFEALQGQYSFVLDDAATQLSRSATIVTDSQGQALIRIRVDNNAITSFGLVRVTDLTTGARLDKSFPIAQVTNGETILTVSPPSWAITGAFKGECSSGFEVGYYIYGGSPPYRVSSSIPSSITLGTQSSGAFGQFTSVPNNGGFFLARTNGGCILNTDPIIFITDATGRTVGVGLENKEGENERPTPPPTLAPARLAVFPLTQNLPLAGTACSGTVRFSVSGGDPPYRVLAVDPRSEALWNGTSPGIVTVTVPDSSPFFVGQTGVVVITDRLQSTAAINATIRCGT
jgi:hypothetical protein